ncbi:hypothetical protein B0H19DRAFT_1149955 [Mycena capillaripes]|nr:hypothetical protein B0H19DRAFT_1149955 [Mycena capillaripes]
MSLFLNAGVSGMALPPVPSGGTARRRSWVENIARTRVGNMVEGGKDDECPRRFIPLLGSVLPRSIPETNLSM